MPNQLAGHTNSFHTHGFDEALAGIAEAGYRYVELSAVPGLTEHVDLEHPDALAPKLAEHGLEPASLSAHSELTTRAGVDHGLAAVRFAAETGIPIVNTAIGGHAATRESEDAFLANIDELADEAERAGVVVALEVHGELMATGAQSAVLLERIARPSVKINYDTGNVEFYGGARAVDDLPAVLPLVAHVHLKDTTGGLGNWDFPALGDGVVDFARVLEILRVGGYAGPYSVELEFRGEPWPPLAEVTQSMRRSREHLRGLGLE